MKYETWTYDPQMPMMIILCITAVSTTFASSPMQIINLRFKTNVVNKSSKT